MSSMQERSNELTRIYKRDKCLQPSVLLKEAKPKTSVLHDDFEWNDKVAGNEYRLSQARRIIRTTPVKVSDAGVRQRFVHVPPAQIEGPTARIIEREGVYKPMAVVAANEDEYGRALKELLAHLRASEQAVRELKKAGGESVKMLPTLSDALKLAKDTVRLMIKEAA